MRRIQLFPLFQDLAIATDGVAESKTVLDLNVPQVRNLLPQCEALFLIAWTKGLAAGNIDWNVALFSGFDRTKEIAAGIDIASAHFGAAGSARCVDYTTTTNFMLESRLQLWWRNKTGINVVKNDFISCVLGARLFGQ